MIYKIILKCSFGSNKGQNWKFVIKQDTIVIGRLKGCHLVLNDERVSQSHCLIQIQGEQLCILDMGSSHGTFVNSQQIANIYYLKNEDVIRIGGTTLILKITHPKNFIFQNPSQTAKKTIVENENIDAQQNNDVSEKNETLIDESLIAKQDISLNKEKEKEKEKEKQSPIYQLETKINNNSQHEHSKQCLLCDASEDLEDIGSHCAWKSCSSCQRYVNFIKEDIANKYQVIGFPLQANKSGFLSFVIDIKKQKHLFLYIYKETHEAVFFDKNIMSPQNFYQINKIQYATFPFLPGEFLTLTFFSSLSFSQKIKLVINIAKSLQICSTHWGELPFLSINSIYIKANGEPIIYGYDIPSNNQKETMELLYFQSPQKILTGQTKNAIMWSFGALVFFLFTKNYLYSQQEVFSIQEEAKNWDISIIREYFDDPIWIGFLLKILAKEKNSYSSWNDIIDALQLLQLNSN